MENIEENVVTKGAKPADPMPSSGIPVEDLGGPTPENYKPDDDSAKLERSIMLHLHKSRMLSTLKRKQQKAERWKKQRQRGSYRGRRSNYR